MKFILKSNAFERLGEATPYDTIPLLAVEAKRRLFLPCGAEALLRQPDSWLELETLLTQQPDKVQALKDGLTLLECFGIAEVKDDPRKEEKPLRVAGERDYRPLSAFLTGMKLRSYGNFDAALTEYLNEDNIRARQFNNFEYNILLRREGELTAAMLIGMPAEDSFSSTCRLAWFVVSEAVQAEEDTALLKAMLDYVKEVFQTDFDRLRYLSLETEDSLVPLLKDYGFSLAAKLLKETDNGHDITVYDCSIPAETL